MDVGRYKTKYKHKKQQIILGRLRGHLKKQRDFNE